MINNGGKTGHPPGLLQDDCRKLHKWFASRPDARYVIRKLFGETNENVRSGTTTHQLHHRNGGG